MDEAITITAPALVLVEGKDDANLVAALAKHLGLAEMVQAFGVGGGSATEYARQLAVVAKSPRFSAVRVLGIMKETDRHPSPEDAFTSACAALTQAGQAVPTEPMELVQGGAGNPAVVVLLVPSSSQKGSLEDVCLKAVHDDPAIPCVDQFFACLDEKGVEQPKHSSKARVQVFLASRIEVGMSMGVAAAKGDLPLQHQAFSDITRFLQMIAAAARA